MTPEQLRARNAAIKRAWDDPLRRALQKGGPKRKLSDDDYAEIVYLHRHYGWSHKELARSFKVSKTMIQKVLDK